MSFSALALERSADTLHYLGSMYYNTERFVDAERAFRESLEIDSNRAETRQNYVGRATNVSSSLVI